MKKQLVLGAFEVMAPTFLANSWRHPLAPDDFYGSLKRWQDLAVLLDAGGFDFLFFAEALAYPMNPDGSVPEVVIREAVQFPVHDAIYAISALAALVDRLGFVVTSSTTVENPYLLARKFGTVDNLTDGRIGWNIVTSDMQVALMRLMGQQRITDHDTRYDRASEFVDACLKLWEGGWSDGAMPRDKATGVFSDPAKVHWVSHHGDFFDVEGYFPIAPSPQRTPTLFQAGASAKGKALAAKYSECVFTQEREIEATAALVADLRSRAVANGRPADSIKIINGLSVIVDDDPAVAARIRQELTDAPSRDAMAALFMGWSGIDVGKLDPDATLADLNTEVGQSLLAQYQDPNLTVREILDNLRTTMGGFKVTGTPASVADEIEAIVDGTDVDGFLIEFTFGGETSYRDFIEKVMPVLRERGLLPHEPRRGSIREILTGTPTPRLPDWHPGAAHRR